MDTKNPEHLKRLRDEILRARRALDGPRKRRQQLVKDYAADYFSDIEKPKRIILNLMQRAISTYSTLLAANKPEAQVSTEYRQLQAFARVYQVSLNNFLGTIPIKRVLQEWVREACFAMGIIRIGLLPIGVDDYGNDPGRPGVEVISFDDWFHDVSAKCWERIRYCGHYYEADLAVLRKDRNLDQKAVAALKPGRNYSVDGIETDPVKDIETGGEMEPAEGYDETVCLCDVWLPRERKLITCDANIRTIIREQDWDGPPNGPYRLLRFDMIPDTVQGLPVGHTLKPLFDLTNSLWRKLARQAQNQKRINTYTPAGEGAMKRLKGAGDGDSVMVEDLSSVGQWAGLGIDPALATFSISTEDEFNRQSGNTEHLAGLGPSADTYGQEKLIGAQVSQRIGKMQDEVADGTKSVIEDLAFYIWHDEVLHIPGVMQITDRELGVSLPVPVEWRPDDREGRFEEFNFDINPFSMAYKSPSEQVAFLTNTLQTLITPLLPMMQEQGVGVDFNAFFESLSQLSGVPTLRDVIVPQSPPQNEKPGPASGGKPPVTSRNYTRRNISTGGTRQGRNVAMAAAYGGTSTPQQAATVMTPAG